MKHFLTTVTLVTILATVGITTVRPQTVQPTATTVGIAYAGDSTTAQTNSWLYQINDPTITINGGFAAGGYTSAQVLTTITPITADVLVIRVGTNDIRLAVPQATTIANVEAIATKVGAARVILMATAPCSITDYGTTHINRQQLGEILNRAYIDLAATHGWLFADASNQFRRLDNSYKTGTSDDQVHPTTAAFGQEAARMEGYIHLAVAGAQP
jgi:lysophospholipase L1-like esterase